MTHATSNATTSANLAGKPALRTKSKPPHLLDIATVLRIIIGGLVNVGQSFKYSDLHLHHMLSVSRQVAQDVAAGLCFYRRTAGSKGRNNGSTGDREGKRE